MISFVHTHVAECDPVCVLAGVAPWLAEVKAHPELDRTLAALPPSAPPAEPLTDQLVEEEIHRVLCMNAKHRSRFTGECRSAPNIARGLRARLGLVR